jgi:HTH-type transcriptional regulator/antitoxin HigA
MLNTTKRTGKMTLTFNSQKYQQLLVNYQPKLIRTEDENQKALSIVEELMHRQNRTIEENELYELLILLIEKFEQEFYQPPTTTPHSMIAFLLEQQNLDRQALTEVLGDSQTVAQLLDQKQKITSQQAKALGDFFQVDPHLFLID